MAKDSGVPGVCGCRFEWRAPEHHRRLAAIEQRPWEGLVELVEMAATWGEVEHGEEEPVIGPSEWFDFAAEHEWLDPARVGDVMIALASLALPAASARSTVVDETPLAPVIELVPMPGRSLQAQG